MTESISRLRAIANGQHGAFLEEQAQALGIPKHVLRGWVESGLLDKVGKRTLRSGFAPPVTLDHLVALVCDIRPDAWVSHRSAAALLHFEGYALKEPFDVTLERGSFAKRPGLAVHTSATLEGGDRQFVCGLTVTNAVRTLIDLAPSLSRKQLTVLFDNCLRDGLLTEDRTIERIASIRSQGKYGIPKLLEVIDGCEPSRGGHTWLERRFLEVSAAHGLPRPSTQVVVGRTDKRPIRVDCQYPGTNLTVELLGYKWHRSRAAMSNDSERMLAMNLKGDLVVQFTYDHLALDVDYVVRSVRAALAVCVKR